MISLIFNFVSKTPAEIRFELFRAQKFRFGERSLNEYLKNNLCHNCTSKL